MNEAFTKIKDNSCDAITFVPNPSNHNETVITGIVYHDAGEKVGGSTLGNSYDITLFREGENTFYDNEQFEAVLVCPYTFSEKMFKDGHFGMIARKTTTSNTIVVPFRERLNMLLGAPNE